MSLSHNAHALAGVLLLSLVVQAQDLPKWEAMDYGPFLSAAIEVDSGNMAYKGIAVPLGDSPDGDMTMLFDTDLLRWAAGWRGDGVALRGIVYDGPHGIHPTIDGEPDWATNQAPGASVDGEFVDLRSWRYGPLDRERLHWKGVHLRDEDVILEYQVGRTRVLEHPARIIDGDLMVYSRDIEVEGPDQELLLEVMKAPRQSLRSMESIGVALAAEGPVNLSTRCIGAVIVRGQSPLMALGVVQAIDGQARLLQKDASVRLQLHPDRSQYPVSARLFMAKVESIDEVKDFAVMLNGMSPPSPLLPSLAPLDPDHVVPQAETAGVVDIDFFYREDSTRIFCKAGEEPRDISLTQDRIAGMEIMDFIGNPMPGADVPVQDGYVQLEYSGQPAGSPVASWTFDEGAGDAMRNETTGKRDLALDGVTWRRGIKGRSLDFDGTARARWTGGDHMDFMQEDLTFSAWIYTTADGTIMSKTRPKGKWVPNGVTFFIRNGSLAFDVGWVGAVEGQATVADGEWHHVAFTWKHQNGEVSLWVDGERDAVATLPLADSVPEAKVQLGFTATDFPGATWFSGFMDGVQVFNSALDEQQLMQVAASTGTPLVQAWLIRGDLPLASWRRMGNGEILLHLDSEPQDCQADLLTWRGPSFSLKDAIARLHGGKQTQRSAFEIDELIRPEENPSNSWMRFGALDFLPGRDAMVASTWSGDVWLIEGVDDDLDTLIWTRIASGLSQPLGLRVRGDEIFVAGRGQITRLHDQDGDEVVDWYENFNNDVMNSEHFHEPVSGLETDGLGNFYLLKAARHAKDACHPHHGTLMKIHADGSRAEVVASGFRAPNGLGIEPDGVFFGSDQEGHWMPANRINRIVPGGFYGNNWTGTPEEDLDAYDLPLVWIHPKVDRSPSAQVRVNMPSWGDLNGRLLGLSYGTGEVYLILEDEVDGVHQGGVVPLPIKVPSGIMSGRFNPADGHLYLAGLVGWSSDATEDGGLYRVRSTGPLPVLPDEIRAVKDGLVVHFTQPLDPAATSIDGWDVTAWNYEWSERYGSPDYKLDGGQGRTVLPVTQVLLSDDRRTAWLRIPSMEPAMQMQLDYVVPSGGKEHEGFAHLTVHRLSKESGRSLLSK
ncbi:MAG: LamG domain-containing protein [Phycisphaerales bacterium]|nr:LamG domain-containing protein [Phycisphaerales bacterium]